MIWNQISNSNWGFESWWPNHWSSQGAQWIENLPAIQETPQVQSLHRADPLEGRATRSSILALENPMDRGAWQATVHRVTQSRTWLKQQSAHTWAKLFTISGKMYASFLLLLGKWPKNKKESGKKWLQRWEPLFYTGMGFSLRQLNSKNVLNRDFPGGPGVEHPLANAGSVDSLPTRGGPHVLEQPSPSTARNKRIVSYMLA